jgi:hypothetical protein
MLANHASAHALARRFPGQVGHLYSPGDSRHPTPELPFALDNGAYRYRHSAGFRSPRSAASFNFWSHCERYARITFGSVRPRARWLAVPDAVGDREATLALWAEYAPRLRSIYASCPPLAFVVQDGMEAGDVPAAADLVFVGGSVGWKWDTVCYWTMHFPRVHVGRVNSLTGLERCHELGVESVDGTGWPRDMNTKPAQWRRLLGYLEAAQSLRQREAA